MSPYNANGLKYEIGKTIMVDEANPDYYQNCAAGINLCPNIENAKEWGCKIILVKVNVCDIVVIPCDDKKFRVKKCKVIKIVNENN